MMDLKILKLKYIPPDIEELGYGEIFDKVEVLTVFHPLMQTFDRFMLVCEVVWGEEADRKFLKDLQIVEMAEEIKRDGKTSLVMVSGQFPEIYSEVLQKFFETFNCFIEFPARLTKEAMFGSIVGSQDNLNKFLSFAEAWGAEYEVLSVQNYHPRIEAALSELTPKQHMCLDAAVREGYFNTPKKIGARDLAKKLGISHATLLEHLKKGEKIILSTLFRS